MRRSQILLTVSACVFITGIAAYRLFETSLNKAIGVESAVVENVDDNGEKVDSPTVYTTDVGQKISIVHIDGSFLTAESFAGLVQQSDAIVIGEPLESIEDSEVRLSVSESDGSLDSFFSVTRFNVERALKGDFQNGRTISIGQSVAILSNADLGISGSGNSAAFQLISLTQKNYRPIRKGARYILFLKKGLAQGADVYFPTGNVVGRVNVDGTDELPNESAVERRIQQYARQAYTTAVQNPGRNPIPSLVEQSIRAFPTSPVNLDDPGINRLPSNIPNLGVQPGRQTTRTLLPASRRSPGSLEN